MNNLHSQLIKTCLLKEGIGPEWWKVGSNQKGKETVFLDLSIPRGIDIMGRLLEYPEIVVDIVTIIQSDNYLEIGISEK